MKYKDLPVCPFFTSSGLSYDVHRRTRYLALHEFVITWTDGRVVHYIDHKGTDSHIRITFMDESFIDASYMEDLRLNVSKLVHVMEI